MTTSDAERERMLYRCLANDLRGVNIVPCDELSGFVIRDPKTNQAMYTAYAAPVGFSSYFAVADSKGYDLADERPLSINAPIFTAVAKIKEHHKRCAPELYAGITETAAAYAAGYWD